MLNNKALASAAVAAGNLAEAIDYDGSADYLSKSSDLTGNADGKTFTFSGWIYRSGDSAGTIIDIGALVIDYTSGADTLTITVPTILSATVTTAVASVIPRYTWTHILISIDLTNTSNRSIYINDVAQSVTWTTYSNSNIDFTVTSHAVGALTGGTSKVNGRLSHIYLDYTYRNLATESNRRLFITADLKPASGQASLNPILYLKMDDPTTPATNSGTGGNFTLNGTIARSGRGPNQYNVPYSDLDGSADYLSKTSITGIADGKTFTFHCCFMPDSPSSSGTPTIFYLGNGTANALWVIVNNNGMFFYAKDSSGTNLLNAQYSTVLTANKNYVLTVSIDMSSTSKRHVYLNGQSISLTWTTYTNSNISFSSSTSNGVGAKGDGSSFFNGKVGSAFFHTSYIDLSVASNLAKFVTGTGIDAKPVDLGSDGSTPLGVQPLIYLPMYGNNAGKNYGSGGDFTVNSGPYTGARGPNEFWGNKAKIDNSGGGGAIGLLRTTQMAGIADSKTFSCSFWTQFNSSSGGVREDNIAGFWIASSNDTFRIYRDTSDQLLIVAGSRLSATVSGTITTGAAFVQICVDLANTAKRFVYINGVAQSVTWSTYVDNVIDFTVAFQTLMSRYTTGATGGMDGNLSEFYFTTEYIDFSQEANRLKFRDAFGNPVDLGSDGSKPTGTSPAIYMRFDPANQGKNYGTGGDFTKTGTIIDGGQL